VLYKDVDSLGFYGVKFNLIIKELNMNNNKQTKLLFSILLILLFTFPLFSQEKNEANGLRLKLDNEKIMVKTSIGNQETKASGEIVFSMVSSYEGLLLELESFNMRANSVKTESGESGNISFGLQKGMAHAEYDEKNNLIILECMLDVHYSLIDKIMGFKKADRDEIESDVYESYTELFKAEVKIYLSERIEPEGNAVCAEGAVIEATLSSVETITGELTAVSVSIEVATAVFNLFSKRWIDIQPVFIRYTPDTGICCGGGDTATTGGSYPILRDRAVEMWDRCCIGLNFLPPVYIAEDDYRILSSAEESSLRASYDNPNAVEVFFVEAGDPLGIHGGGVCFSIGTANTQVITYDINLPINFYNLAHELGHSLDLLHPPGNSTEGSLMEPSGFTKDNPPLMSSENCNNVSNPLLYYPDITQSCTDDPNM
jgi:hypothetical protein